MSTTTLRTIRIDERPTANLIEQQERFDRLRRGAEQSARRLALDFTGNASDAADLLQNTYLRAWRSFHTYAEDKSFINWLAAIMKNVFIDDYRKQNEIRKAVSTEEIGRTDHSRGMSELPIVDHSASPYFSVAIEEQWQQLMAIFDELPENYRSVILLKDVDDLSYEEIAEELCISRGAVRSRLHRGRQLLRELIEERGVNEPAMRVEWSGRGIEAIGAAISTA